MWMVCRLEELSARLEVRRDEDDGREGKGNDGESSRSILQVGPYVRNHVPLCFGEVHCGKKSG